VERLCLLMVLANPRLAGSDRGWRGFGGRELGEENGDLAGDVTHLHPAGFISGDGGGVTWGNDCVKDKFGRLELYGSWGFRLICRARVPMENRFDSV
jgi:hypothetical protein